MGEESASVRSCLQDKGFEAWSCDLQPSRVPGNHYQGDVFDIIRDGWTHLIAFPPCTYLAKAQIWRCLKDPERMKLSLDAVDFVNRLFNSGINHVAIENPTGMLSASWRPPDQVVYPWWFGDGYSKEINLWLKGFPPLMATCYSPGRRPVANHTNGRMSQAQKSRIKSSWEFYPGMIEALVNQWFVH